eukprot:s456_g14.t2
MTRKDRYNKKTLKYYVTYNEDDSDNDMQIDTERHEESETGKKRLGLSGPTSGALEKVPTVAGSDEESEEENEKEKKSTELTQGQQAIPWVQGWRDPHIDVGLCACVSCLCV